MPCCAAINCSRKPTKEEREKGFTFHRFPHKQPERLKQWLVKMRRANFYPSSSAVLCSAHFEESCFYRFGQNTQLKDDAIPTIFDFPKHLLKEVEKNNSRKRKRPPAQHSAGPHSGKVLGKDAVPAPSSCPTDTDTEAGPSPGITSEQGPIPQGQQETGASLTRAKRQKGVGARHARAKRQKKSGLPDARAKRQKIRVSPTTGEGQQEFGTSYAMMERLGGFRAPHITVEKQEDFGTPRVAVEREEDLGAPHVKRKEHQEFGASVIKTEVQQEFGSTHTRAEEHHKFGSPPVHSLAYLHWKRLGAQQGLEEDRDIACFLLRYYEHTSKVMLSGLTGVCKTCGTPLSISCHRCDWTINADAPCTSPPHQTSGNTAAEREGGGDGTGGDRGEHPLHHHPPHSADGLSPSLVVGSAESEDMKDQAEEEEERDGTEKTTGADFRDEKTMGEDICDEKTMGEDICDEKTMGEDICDEKTMGEDIRGATDTVGRRTADHHQPFLVLTVEDSVDPDCDSARDFPAETRDDSSSAHPSREIVDDSEPCVTDDCHEDDDMDNNDNYEESEGDTGDDDSDDSCRYFQGDAEHEDTASICDVDQEDNPLVCEGEEEEEAEPTREDSEAASVCFVVHANDGTGEALTLDDTEDAHRRCQALDAQHTTTLDGSEATWMHLLDEESDGIGEPSALDTKPPCFSDHASDGTTLESSSLEGQTCLPVQATDDDTGETVHDDSEAVDHATVGPRESPVADDSHGAADVLQHGVNDSAAEPPATDCTRPSPHCAAGHTDDGGEGKPRQDDLDGTGKCLLDHSYHLPSAVTGQVSSLRPFQCDECGKTFKYSYGLKAHHLIHRGHQFICDVCGKSFTLASSLWRHQGIHNTQKPFKCDTSNLPFRTRQNLQRHQKIHADKGFVCDTCGRAFRGERTLKKHSLIHTDLKPFECNTCGRKFREESNLKTHSLIQTDQKQFACDECGQTFTKKGNLNLHKVCHVTTTSPKAYVCDKCGKTFHWASTLHRHRNVHQKPFMCDVCGKAFSTKYRLQAHERVHSGEKPFVCNICGFAFSNSANLYKIRESIIQVRNFREHLLVIGAEGCLLTLLTSEDSN